MKSFFIAIAMGHSFALFPKTLVGCSPLDAALKNSASNAHTSSVIAELSQAIANNIINQRKG